MKYAFFLLFVMVSIAGYSQTKYKVTYNKMGAKDIDGNWMGQFDLTYTFVIDANSSEITRYDSAGSKEVFNITSKLVRKSLQSYDYYELRALDGDGDEVTITIFDDAFQGLYIFYSLGNVIHHHTE